jgi:hypothetical protein
LEIPEACHAVRKRHSGELASETYAAIGFSMGEPIQNVLAA